MRKKNLADFIIFLSVNPVRYSSIVCSQHYWAVVVYLRGRVCFSYPLPSHSAPVLIV